MSNPEYLDMQQLTAEMPAEADRTGSHQQGMSAITDRFGGDIQEEIGRYLAPDEQLQGFGSGGSESLVMVVNTPTYGRVVRKVCSEVLSAVPWDPNGTGVMTPPSTKGGLQVSYLQGLPQSVQPYFPAVHKVQTETEPTPDGGTVRRLVYDQTLLTGVEVSSFVAEAQPTPGVVAHLHHEVMRLLAEKVHPHRLTQNGEDTIQESYLDKITARLELSRQAAPETFGPLLDSERIVINGVEYSNIKGLLKFFGRPEVREMLEPQHHALVMGDTNTENVMITHPDVLLDAMRQSGRPEFTYDDIGLKFLDPRAIGFRTTGGDTVDDPMYDNKPVHNSIGNYDVMHNEHFDLSVGQGPDAPTITVRNHANNPYTKPYEGMEDYFKYVMEGWGVANEEFRQRDPNWLLRFTFMMGSHFAAMPPFHFTRDETGRVPEDPDAQKRAIAIYAEGIKWLSMARDMIIGDRRDLYGMPVGKIKPSNR
ncbi:MAG TPA: hypothetical protein VFT16_02495 [Candidatus Saccharimonadales bacterium]|nr:hypothetical protein [Candidatus Saccharimonadales bacterium]